jgi:hypothetical protein
MILSSLLAGVQGNLLLLAARNSQLETHSQPAFAVAFLSVIPAGDLLFFNSANGASQ